MRALDHNAARAALAFVVLSSQLALTAGTNTVAAAVSSASAAFSAPRKIDLDLARMSKTMRDAWSARIVANPEKLAGKTVQIRGDFYVHEEGPGAPKRYVCALKDPAGCCAIGEVEFRLRGKYEWPKDFPEEFAGITVNGRLEVAHNGDGTAQPRLVDADIVRNDGK